MSDMTDIQRAKVLELRKKNIGYSIIAKEVGLNKDSV